VYRERVDYYYYYYMVDADDRRRRLPIQKGEKYWPCLCYRTQYCLDYLFVVVTLRRGATKMISGFARALPAAAATPVSVQFRFWNCAHGMG